MEFAALALALWWRQILAVALAVFVVVWVKEHPWAAAAIVAGLAALVAIAMRKSPV